MVSLKIQIIIKKGGLLLIWEMGYNVFQFEIILPNLIAQYFEFKILFKLNSKKWPIIFLFKIKGSVLCKMFDYTLSSCGALTFKESFKSFAL